MPNVINAIGYGLGKLHTGMIAYLHSSGPVTRASSLESR